MSFPATCNVTLDRLPEPDQVPMGTRTWENNHLYSRIKVIRKQKGNNKNTGLENDGPNQSII